MALTMVTADRGLKRKMAASDESLKPPKKESKRKSASKTPPRAEQNNNVKRQRISGGDAKEDMFLTYQPWVIQTYGDLAKTKTITVKKYARILRTLRGEEVASADNSKFRFWVKAKGFHVGKPAGYDAKPADAIVGRYSVCDADEGIPPVNGQLSGSAKDPSLYVPNAPLKVSAYNIYIVQKLVGRLLSHILLCACCLVTQILDLTLDIMHGIVMRIQATCIDWGFPEIILPEPLRLARSVTSGSSKQISVSYVVYW